MISAWDIHTRDCPQCQDAITSGPKPFRGGQCPMYIEDQDDDPSIQCPHPPDGTGPLCQHHRAGPGTKKTEAKTG